MSCTKLQLPPEPLTRGLPSPDPHSLCPLSSTEFVETPPPNKIPGYATDNVDEVLRLVLITTEVFWLMTLHQLLVKFWKKPPVSTFTAEPVYSRYGGNTFLHNAGNHIPHHTVL